MVCDIHSHEALDSLPEIRCGSRRGVGGQGKVGVGISATCAGGCCIVWATVVRKLNHKASGFVDIARNGDRIGQASLGRRIDEKHVADLVALSVCELSGAVIVYTH